MAGFLYDWYGPCLSLRSDCTRRTSICASTAIDANIRVNYINIALRNSAGWTLAHTSTTSYAVI